jgi:hypothetical protein
MNNFVVLTDTRQQKESHILKEFDKQGIIHIRTTLPSADYMMLRYDEEKGMYLDYSILIDTKKDLEEIAGNLCNSVNHERIKREIAKGKELGCENFIFLIGNNKIKTIQDLENWTSKRTRVKGSTLLKVMSTMKERYNVRFIIVSKKEMGKQVLKLLEVK